MRKAERLAVQYDTENGFFLAFSGGKDSQVLYHVARLAGVRFKAHMNLTSVDPPEVIRFVKSQYPDVVLKKPGISIFQEAVNRQILPTMRVRWCCATFKEQAGAGKVTLIGIRHAESVRRSKRNEVEISSRKFSGDMDGLDKYREEYQTKKWRRKATETTIVNADGEQVVGCIHGKETLLISPIIHWSDDDVWEFLNKMEIPHCELYDQGWHRIGCINCPMSSPRQKLVENERWAHVKRNWIKAIKAIRRGGYSKTDSHGGTSDTNSYPPRNAYQKDLWTAERMDYQQQRGKQVHHPTRLDAVRLELEGQQRSVGGFSDSSSPVGLTEEQENEIAENIYDWWISGKSYDRWYAEKFQQTKIDFKDNNP